MNTSAPHHIYHIFFNCRSTGHWTISFVKWKKFSDLNKTSYLSVIKITLICIRKKKTTKSPKIFLTRVKHTSLLSFADYNDLSNTVWQNSSLKLIFFFKLVFFHCSQTQILYVPLITLFIKNTNILVSFNCRKKIIKTEQVGNEINDLSFRTMP